MKIATRNAIAVSDRSPPDKQREPLHLLARRPGLELDPGRKHVVRLGEDQLALAAGENAAEDLLELPRGVGERVGKHLLHPVVDLLDHREQVTAGLAEILELGDQERVPLFERGELLERQRVDLAKLVKLALGLVGPMLLRRPGQTVAPAGHHQPAGTGTSGPYSPTSASTSTANSSDALASTCSSFICLLARATSVPCAVFDDLVELA